MQYYHRHYTEACLHACFVRTCAVFLAVVVLNRLQLRESLILQRLHLLVLRESYLLLNSKHCCGSMACKVLRYTITVSAMHQQRKGNGVRFLLSACAVAT
jgi:hypothetical protein